MARPSSKANRPSRVKKPAILIGHEKVAIGRAAACVLGPHGFEVQVVQSGDAVRRILQMRRWDGLVMDVAMPGPPSFELTELAKTKIVPPVSAVILVATVHRRTSYKRRPARLYGADDYVEIHRLSEELPEKLWALVEAEPTVSQFGLDAALLRVLEGREEDGAFPRSSKAALAEVLVADMVLHHADQLIMALDEANARAIVADAIGEVRAKYRQLVNDEPTAVDEAFAKVVTRLGFARAR